MVSLDAFAVSLKNKNKNKNKTAKHCVEMQRSRGARRLLCTSTVEPLIESSDIIYWVTLYACVVMRTDTNPAATRATRASRRYHRGRLG